MRILLRAQLDVAASNKAIQDGSLAKIVGGIMEDFRPESAYFLPMDGKRTMIFVFDLKEESDIPFIAERLFMNLNASVEMIPVMKGEDLVKGLAKVMR